MSRQNEQNNGQAGAGVRRCDEGMDFEGHLKSVWQLVQDEPLFVVGGGLLVQFLIAFSFGLLTGPMGGSYFQVLIAALREKRKPQLNDIISGLGRFGSLFPYFLLLLLTVLGFIFLFVPGVLFITWWLYVLPLMADRNLSLGAAMGESRALVQRKGFFLHLVFILMISVVPSMVINVLSGVLPPLAALHLLLFPLQCVCLASLYLEQFDGLSPAGFHETGSPPPPPPPSPAPPSPPPPPVNGLPPTSPGTADATGKPSESPGPC